MEAPKRADGGSTDVSPKIMKGYDHEVSLAGRAPKVDLYTVGAGRGRTRIQAILEGPEGHESCVGKRLTVGGWARTVRKQGSGQFCFVALSDGSTVATLQIVVHDSMPQYELVAKSGAGCSFKFTGMIEASPAAGQPIEMRVADPENDSIVLLGGADASKYPLSKKQHSREFLRDIAHLRPRTYLMGVIMRVRSQMAMATHRFFQDRGFVYIHAPLITTSDCEGAGEMFQVTTVLKDQVKDLPATSSGAVDYKSDFFGRKAYLTVSGQLSVEAYCCSLSDVYTFGPTFRAENSHTSRHLAEFWMIEPEIAFADIYDNMDCAESYLKYCVDWALTNCSADLKWLDETIEEGLIDRLTQVLEAPFVRLTYTDAVEKLKEYSDRFEVKPEWGVDLGAEHERCLTEEIYKKPVIVYNYPKAFKAFYMRQNDDGLTVRAMDVLLPKVGEVIGGSQREERLDKLDALILEKGLKPDSYWWYRELRQYGTVPHSGYGLGFERLIMMITGVDNIRDVIPFPRFPGHADF